MSEHEGGGGGGGAIRELLAVFGFKVDTEELVKSETKIEKYFERVGRLATAFAGVFVAHEIFEFAEANVHAMSEIEHAAARLGVAAEQVQVYQFAAKSLGLEGESLINMLGRLQVTQEGAIAGSQESAKAFHDVGISVHALKGMDADTLFHKVADGIAKQKDASKQAAIATQLFGRQGRELLPILKEGGEALDEYAALYKELGGGYSEAAIEKAKEFEAANAKLTLTTTALKSKAMEKLLPIVISIVNWGTKAVKWITDMTKNSYLLQSALGVLSAAAAVFAVELAIANAPILLVTAAIAALILIVDDFVTMMEGGDSVIGDTIDKIFGKDAHLDTVKEIKEIWSETKDVFGELWREVKLIWDAFKWWKDNLGAIGDAIGDALGKAHNYFVESAPAKGVKRFTRAKGELARDYGRGGLSFEQNQSGLNAQRVLEAAARGEDISKVPLSLGKGETRAHELEIVKQWLPGIISGQFPQFTPRAEGPLPSPIVINQQITAAEGMDEKKLGEHAAQEVHKVLKQNRRAAAATLPRKVAQ